MMLLAREILTGIGRTDNPLLLLLLLLVVVVVVVFILTADGVLPGVSGTRVRHNTQITQHARKNTAHKTPQTIRVTL
jgi:hypothetical protein